MTGPVPDKRKGKPRILRRLPVRFGTDAKMCGGVVSDISEGGMRIESPESFAVNSVITVFVQFPRHSVRLRVRVIWCSAAGGGAPIMGLALTQPEPTLKRAYAEWVAEVKLAAAEIPPVDAPAATAPPPEAPRPEPAPAPPAAAPPAAEPKGPITRRLESRQGQSYEAILERQPQGWNLTIVQLPRQLGVGAPDFVGSCPDYASAEKALRDFVRSH
ncbi:MAG TPA: PilZ domain-containing protein [Candidatus Dormibacteraeota bacterium]|nr:PilZ domain-containing protein [Candidatus Dormibacteraeota bacterium]